MFHVEHVRGVKDARLRRVFEALGAGHYYNNVDYSLNGQGLASARFKESRKERGSSNGGRRAENGLFSGRIGCLVRIGTIS